MLSVDVNFGLERMESSISSLTYKGSIPEAIAEAKNQKKLLVVYISGNFVFQQIQLPSILDVRSVIYILYRWSVDVVIYLESLSSRDWYLGLLYSK